ncbi:MAG: sensory histidine kinase AtoS [Candidatus Methanofastidiosum methylothiophilum]|uniref:Sensory histidine kinase AtoS n=1 Tax=Candidatus Methanofastidiosum methylothiophilum TaxID=1705564 RepID=A0A150JA76_9EURY|nr:MAG: sensory histidine kinase AtoS [Candidatus Methanofastidiosum methylthiophilus]NMC77638.1 PAS domain S-box protein [Candidatus Methanofastidiosa archaeon]
MSNNNEFTPPTFTFTNSISKNFALPMAEIVVDKIVFANEAFTQLTGYSHKDLEKMNFSGLLSHSVRDSIMEVLNSIHKVSLFSYTTIAPIIKKDGFDTLCEIKFDFLERDGIKSVLASFKEQNQSKGINLSPLISEKLDSIKRLSASLSHEINNPLNVIVNYLYIIENTKDEEKRKGYIKTIYQEVERIAGILNWLLDFSSYIHGEISAVDVNEEIKRAIELVENDFSSKNISIFFNTCEDCIVPFTEGQLQRAILNLLLNAKDAIKENDRQSKVVINVTKNEDYIDIEVRDNGIGISPDNLERIFDPFFTTKSFTNNRGIGLPMTHRIIESHGGKIYVDSILDKGTSVKICLPRRRINGKV